MSSFCGLIEEIPGISVDRFDAENLKSSVYFLSHGHTDHMKGLDSNFFQYLEKQNRSLYCTSFTKLILQSKYGLNSINSLGETIETIDGYSPVTISFTNIIGYAVTMSVTGLPAGHCPGSTMFLFEYNNMNILYTGDFRLNSNDLSKIQSLHDNVAGTFIPKFFDVIYLDTTFFNIKYSHFPLRQDSMHKIYDIAKDWINKHKTNIVVLECSANYGSEYLFMELASKLKSVIHVKDSVYNNYSVVPELQNCITNNPLITPIHACMYKSNRNKLLCRPEIEQKYILTIVPSAYRWKNKDPLKNMTEWDVDKNRVYVCYSSHASHYELLCFIKYFKSKKLYPCVCPSEMNFNDFFNELNETLNNTESKNNSYELTPLNNRITNDMKMKVCHISDEDDNI